LYPFREKVTLTVLSNSPVRFPLSVRIPRWCSVSRVFVNGLEEPRSGSTSFHKIDRTWKNGDRVILEFPMGLVLNQRENQSMSVVRGPLVYSLKVAEKWRRITHHPDLTGPTAALFPSWEVLPASDWNYALVLNKANPDLSFEVVEKTVKSTQPFSPQGAPIEIHAEAKKVPEWRLNEWGMAGVPPKDPVVVGAAVPVTLVPFGSTRLRVTYLPVTNP
jgi:hypothetical protein